MLKRIQLLGVVMMSAALTQGTNVRGALLQGYPAWAEFVHRDAGSAIEQLDSRGPVTVGAGVEFSDVGAGLPSPPQHPVHFDIDISDTQIVITALTDQPPNDRDALRVGFDPLNTLPPLHLTQFPEVGARVNPATTWSGFNQFRASVTGQNVTVQMSGLTGSSGQQIVLDIIPEPGSAALAAAAAAGLAAAGRRRKT